MSSNASLKLYEKEIRILLSIPEENRTSIFAALLAVSVGEQPPQLNPLETAIYELIKGQTDRAREVSEKRSQSGKLGNDKRWNENAGIANDRKSIANDRTYTITSTITNTNTSTKDQKIKRPRAREDKKSNPTPEKVIFADFVSMTNDEYSSLVAKLGEPRAKRCIEILDNYKGANGKKYASDYRAILNWVVARLEEDEQKGGGANAIKGGTGNAPATRPPLGTIL